MLMTFNEVKAAIAMGGDEHGLPVDLILARAMRMVAAQDALPLTVAAATEEVLREFCWLRSPGEVFENALRDFSDRPDLMDR